MVDSSYESSINMRILEGLRGFFAKTEGFRKYGGFLCLFMVIVTDESLVTP